MQGFHCLMRIAHMLNAMALHTRRVAAMAKNMGMQDFLKFVRDTCAHRWLSREWRRAFVNLPFQLRLE